jgi:tellurite resistance protein
MDTQARLQHFPISWFAMVMGLSGLSIAWHKSETLLALPINISHYVLWLTIAVFIILAVFYGVKLLRYREEVVKELKHPIKINFFPTFSIGLILLSIALLHHEPGISRILWVTGASLHLLFTLYVLSVWIHHTHFEIHHINPAWFIPIVGNILVPIAGVSHASPEIAWFFFSIGLLFWLVLLTIIVYRMLFHQPLPARMIPTLFILIAPPAVGFISWMQLTGELDAFGRILYYAAFFLTLMLVSQIRRFIRLKFFLSWWAYSFPIAAITIATLLMYQQVGLPFFKLLAIALLLLLSLVILLLIYRTLLAVFKKEICVEE